ncbi:MAG: NAD(P)-dependent oxidoreductase, partial [Coprobacillus sp.]
IISRNLKIDAQLIDQCQSLKLIVIHGSGYDDVDVNYLKQKNIHLCNTPGYNALSVSELIVTMMLNLSRQINKLSEDYKNNKIHTVAPVDYIGHEITGKTFGMIGVGDIAIKTAQILKQAFQMNIIAFSRSLTIDKANELGFIYCDTMEDVFKNADFVSLGTSLNEQTFHMITKKQLSLMKPSAYLINTSRGAVINEEDLYIALKDKWFAGAGLDVLENEPVSYNHPLLQLDNVLYSPHMGATTDEALKRVGNAVVDMIMLYNDGRINEHFLF